MRICFNPRAHVGRDVRYKAMTNNTIGFNPRAHVGRDIRPLQSVDEFKVSIHAPTWDATIFGDSLSNL